MMFDDCDAKDRGVIRSPHYITGVVLVLLSGVVLSTLGVGLRQIESAGGWQILFYRAFSFTFTLLLIVAIRSRGRLIDSFRGIGRRGFVVGAFLACASTMYVFAMLNTTVANATFVVSTAPFVTAGLGWIVLREPVGVGTWAAMAVALVGVSFMVADGLGGGGLLGILFAAGVTLATAGMLVTVRGAAGIDMIPALAIAGVLTAVVTFFLVDDFSVSRHDLVVISILGAGQYAIGFALLTAGTRYVPVAEVGLLSLLETVLAPIWAWLGAGEVPSTLTLVGGTVVLLAATARAVAGVRQATH